MLTEQRYEQILRLLDQKRSITVAEVRELLDISESTVRRDITALHNAGRLTKVFGGAVAKDYHIFTTQEPTVEQKMEEHPEEKRKIARYAASLISPSEFVYLDAGTTTGCMLEYLTDTSVVYVTNAVAHAQYLVKNGMSAILIGGQLKASTEALIGSRAMKALADYNFTKGFFGTNGITKKTGFTTPDSNEASVKEMAMRQCKEKYVVSDASKFDKISSVTFSKFTKATVLTDRIPEGYEGLENVIKVPDEIDV